VDIFRLAGSCLQRYKQKNEIAINAAIRAFSTSLNVKSAGIASVGIGISDWRSEIGINGPLTAPEFH
jgi:hypothetical protein